MYGSGRLLIAHDDIEHLVTEKRYDVLYGDYNASVGRLLGVVDGELVVGDDSQDAVRINVATLMSARVKEGEEWSRLDSLRSTLRYWKANVDFGFAATQSTNDTTSVTFGLGTERKKSPTRLVLTSSYRLDTQKRRDEDQTTLKRTENISLSELSNKLLIAIRASINIESHICVPILNAQADETPGFQTNAT